MVVEIRGEKRSKLGRDDEFLDWEPCEAQVMRG